MLSLPTSMVPHYWHREVKNRTTMYIEDVISLDSKVLVLIQKPPNVEFPNKESLECRYGDTTHFLYRKVTALHLYSDRAALLCSAPPQDFPWDVNSILIEVEQSQEIHPKVTIHGQPLQWSAGNVVYESFPTETDVVVFVHGIDHTRGAHLPVLAKHERLMQFQCVYGGYFETHVTAQAQEVFRCPHPPVNVVHQFAGKKISIRFEGKVLPSVAYYNPHGELSPPERETTVNRKLMLAASEGASVPKHHVCSCTMIYNGAKFLKEWVYYNSHLGVEKFFLYDNNSEDDLDEVLAALGRGGFEIQKLAWPWVKTQEAGFSHCSLVARNECKWMLFTDIDEFFFPSKRFLNASSEQEHEVAEVPTGIIAPQAGILPRTENSSILAGFIEAATTGHDLKNKVGQISTFCHNFGPSGWTVSPPQGVTQGYTCRLKKTERHKSIVLLSSIHNSLENVIHHFSLKRGYGRKLIRPGTAVINHYKFQAWDEFKTKFHRRAATYVADWTEDRNHASKDRVPDLGTKAIKPADWESRYCEVQDFRLRNYTQLIFGSYDRGNTLHLPWE